MEVSGARHAYLCATLVVAIVACILATPGTALAAMVCTAASMSDEPAARPSDDAPWTLLEVELPDDDTIEVTREQAPMSLSEGASAVAPRSVQPTSDARIEASERCTDRVGAQELASPYERLPIEPPSSVMDASLPGLPWSSVGAPFDTITLPLRHAAGARGVARDIDRPPRR